VLTLFAFRKVLSAGNETKVLPENIPIGQVRPSGIVSGCILEVLGSNFRQDTDS
jgi:hypothetical protein